jgi:succinate-semialdehyde dehydrogenase/glutarate-semialdehyde dehydrogenase
VHRFGDEADAIRIANNTPFGLAAYLFTRDHARIWRAGEGLDYGMIAINTGFISAAEAPFGGVKESGIGREGSQHGIEDFLELKYMAWAGIRDAG